MQAKELAELHKIRGESFMAEYFAEVKLKAPRKTRPTKVLSTMPGRNKRDRRIHAGNRNDRIHAPGKLVVINGGQRNLSATQ